MKFFFAALVCFFLVSSLVVDTCQGEVWYVKIDGSDEHGGTGWDDAFQSIQKAIASSSDGDEIWMAQGIYDAPVNFYISIAKAVGIYGGFSGTETQRDQRDWQNNVTTVEGQGLAIHCFWVTADAIIDGLSITGGNADSIQVSGGGIYNSAASCTIANCTIYGNSAFSLGGGIYNNGTACAVTNCIFRDNTADKGGGMYNDASCVVSRCTFYNNQANHGGGFYNSSASCTVGHSLFYGNIADKGGGIYNNTCVSAIINCTFCGNGAYDMGGGIYHEDFPYPRITNCILWADTAPSSPEVHPGHLFPVRYCNVQGGYNGTGNMSASPRFADPGSRDFHLRSGSPCIDAGDPVKMLASDYLGGSSLDLDGTSGISAGDTIWITDGVHRESDGVVGIQGATVVLAAGFVNSYMVADGSYVYTHTSNFSGESEPNGSRINIGAYGGTPEATTAICRCGLDPDATVIPRGGTLGFEAAVINNTDQTGTVLFATRVTLPDGRVYPASDYLYGPIHLSLTPYQSRSKHLSHTIPSNAQLGTYTYHGYVGRPGPSIYHECQFCFEVYGP